ncbi:MAG: calcium/proton exchanger [Chromatiales bacterium]|nr:calcium/proton exchanger [Chromatiales bacterium]
MSLKPSLNWLLAFSPVAIGLEMRHAEAPLVFFAAALSIVPIAALLVHATEQLAVRTGDAVGGLLNATFGNAPELIIAIVALKAGLMQMVLASIIGAVLANLLLALGLAFFLGGLKKHDQEYNAGAARVYSSIMLITVIMLAAPGAFENLFGAEAAALKSDSINVGLAVLLLALYVLYLVFMLKTHPDLFVSKGGGPEAHSAEWSVGRAVGTLVAASVGAAFMSEILVGAAEATGEALGMSQVFIGVVLLALIGGAAELGAAVTMGMRDRLDLSIGIALGSCMQIALFVAPVLVLVSYFIAPEPLRLEFNRTAVGALLLSVLIGAVVSADGHSNWYKGVQLVAVYLVLALLMYLAPGM